MYLLLIALLILIPGLAFVPIYWPAGIQKTFSQHVAPRQASINYYRALFLIVLPILYTYFATYLVPTLKLPTLVLYLVAASSFAQIGCTLIPETGGRKTTVHLVLAAISALLLLGILASLLSSSAISFLDRTITDICLAVMVSVVLIVSSWKKTELPGLILQSGYFAAFFIALLFVTF